MEPVVVSILKLLKDPAFTAIISGLGGVLIPLFGKYFLERSKTNNQIKILKAEQAIKDAGAEQENKREKHKAQSLLVNKLHKQLFYISEGIQREIESRKNISCLQTWKTGITNFSSHIFFLPEDTIKEIKQIESLLRSFPSGTVAKNLGPGYNTVRDLKEETLDMKINHLKQLQEHVLTVKSYLEKELRKRAQN